MEQKKIYISSGHHIVILTKAWQYQWFIHESTHAVMLFVFIFIPVSCMLRITHSSSASVSSISSSCIFLSHTFGAVSSKLVFFFVVYVMGTHQVVAGSSRSSPLIRNFFWEKRFNSYLFSWWDVRKLAVLLICMWNIMMKRNDSCLKVWKVSSCMPEWSCSIFRLYPSGQ